MHRGRAPQQVACYGCWKLLFEGTDVDALESTAYSGTFFFWNTFRKYRIPVHTRKMPNFRQMTIANLSTNDNRLA